MKNLYLFLCLLLSSSVFSQTVTHGPITGGVSDNSCRIFIRTDVSVAVTIELSTSSSFSAISASATVTTDASKDTVAIAHLTGLSANTKYYVRAMINGAASGPPSSFRTFLAPSAVARQVFTAGSCHYDITSDDSSLYVQMASDSPKVFLQCGDWGYPDAATGTNDLYFTNPPTSYAADINNHRTFYKMRYSCPGTFSFLHSFPVDYVYDDHDYLNDNSAQDAASGFKLGLPLGAPVVISQPPIARLNSIEAYREWFPSYPLVDSTEGIYHSFRSGNVEVFFPDLRSMRTPQASAVSQVGGQWVYNPPAGYTMLGAEQTLWLKNALINSTATWKIIISTDAFNISLRKTVDTCLKIGGGNVPFWGAGIAGIPNYGYIAWQNYGDCWAGFKEACDSLVRYVIDNNIKNVFVVSGDTHTVGMDDGTNSGLPELNCGILKKANSEEWVINQAFMGFNVWNKGGSGLCQGTNFESAYSKIETFGNDSIRLSAVDASGAEVTGWTFMVNEPYKYNPLNRPNHLPIAANDGVNITSIDTVIIPVTGNDADFEHDPLFVNLQTLPSNGTATVNSDNTITYIPAPNFTGVDTFRYLACDHSNPSCLNCSSARVTVTVGPSSVFETSRGTIEVYPNPAQNIVNISSTNSQKIEVEMLNLLGARMLKQTIVGRGTINTSVLAAGDYVLSITNPETRESRKIKLSITR